MRPQPGAPQPGQRAAIRPARRSAAARLRTTSAQAKNRLIGVRPITRHHPWAQQTGGCSGGASTSGREKSSAIDEGRSAQRTLRNSVGQVIRE